MREEWGLGENGGVKKGVSGEEKGRGGEGKGNLTHSSFFAT